MLLHITESGAWQAAQRLGQYCSPSLETEGFIHCSMPKQVLGPANAFYRGQRNLVLLCIDPNKIQAAIVYEDCYNTGEKFPHIYGPINLDAVFRIVDFPPLPDGTFALPMELRTIQEWSGIEHG